MLGSEGALGVITRVALRVRPLAEARATTAGRCASFVEGAELLRALEQDGLAPDIARLSDEEETRPGVALRRRGARRALRAARGCGGRCLLDLRLGGRADAIARRRAPRRGCCARRRAAARAVGRARRGRASRFAGPHLRDDLLDRGVLVETLETATTWSQPRARCTRRRARARGALAGAARAAATSRTCIRPARRCTSPCSPRRTRRPVAQWRRAKAAACDAIVAAGGTITHHHAVGRDHAPYLGAEIGALGHRGAARGQGALDPAGIMNPGKLLAPSRAAGGRR